MTSSEENDIEQKQLAIDALYNRAQSLNEILRDAVKNIEYLEKHLIAALLTAERIRELTKV